MLYHSTETIHPRDRLSFWTDVVIKSYCNIDFRCQTRPAFEGMLRVGALAGIGVGFSECSPVDIERHPRQASKDGMDDFVVCLQITGTTVREHNGRQFVCPAGSIALADMGRYSRFIASEQYSVVTLSIPRHALEARVSLASIMAWRPDGQHALVQLLFAYMAGLPNHIDGIEGVAASKVADQTLDLLALAISEGTGHKTPVLSSARSAALLRLKTAIGDRLYDPHLKPAEAAAAAGISVRYANDLLSNEGTSVERYITEQRLDRCRRALEDPHQSGRTIADIAFGWGFSEVSHFGRRFKARFGLSPKDYRQYARDIEASRGSQARRPGFGPDRT